MPRPNATRIALARIEDAGEMGAVHVRVWRETYPGIVPQHVLDELSPDERAARWRQVLSEPKPQQCVYCAFDASGLAGFAGGGPTRDAILDTPGELYMINVLRRAHATGVGRLLMQAVFHSLRSSGFQSIGLWVFEANAHAHEFYRHLGGVESDARHYPEFDGVKVPELAVHWPDASLTKRRAPTA
jgi:GNAT superfamily N-acetyltransferase